MAMLPQFQPPQAAGQGAPPAAAEIPHYDGRIDVMKAIKFVLSDEQNKWAHIGYGLLLFVIPVVGPLTLMGWFAEVAQRLVRQHPQPIPKFDFNDFVTYLQRGLTPFIVGLILVIPLIFVIYALFAVVIFGAAAVTAAIGEPIVMPFAMIFGSLLMILVTIPMQVVLAGAQIRADLTEDFSKAMNFGWIMNFGKKMWWRFFIYSFLLGLIIMPMAFAGMLACGIGLYVVVVIQNFANLHLRHQLYAAYVAEGGEPIPLKPQALQAAPAPQPHGY